MMTTLPPAEDRLAVGVRLFARYAELLETGYLTLSLPRGAAVSDAIEALRARPGGNALPPRMLVARNLEQVEPAALLREGDELALLPPLAGG